MILSTKVDTFVPSIYGLYHDGVIPLALANVLELPLCMVSRESLSVSNNRLRHRGSLTSVSSEMEENEQDTFSVSFMLYLSEALDDDTIKKFLPFHHVATYETCFIYSKTGQCNRCISKQAHGWGQYYHNSGAAGMWFGHQGRWLGSTGLSWIMCVLGILGDTPGSVDEKVLSPCKNQMKVLRPHILRDLEVVHRPGKPAPGTAGSVDVPIP